MQSPSAQLNFSKATPGQQHQPSKPSLLSVTSTTPTVAQTQQQQQTPFSTTTQNTSPIANKLTSQLHNPSSSLSSSFPMSKPNGSFSQQQPSLSEMAAQKQQQQQASSLFGAAGGRGAAAASNPFRAALGSLIAPEAPSAGATLKRQEAAEEERRFSERLRGSSGGGFGGAAAQQHKQSNFDASNCDIDVAPASSGYQSLQQTQPLMSGGGGRYSRQQHADKPPQQQRNYSAVHQRDSYTVSDSFGGGGGGSGGRGGSYNFQRIMDDHFEHYRRPPSRPPSREQSVDRLPSALSEAGPPPRPPSSTAASSRPGSRPPSRARAPMLQRSGPVTSMDDSASAGMMPNSIGSGPAGAGAPNTGNGELRRRGAGGADAVSGGFGQPPSQEIHNLGTVPKRTESLYMKYTGDSKVTFHMSVPLHSRKRKCAASAVVDR